MLNILGYWCAFFLSNVLYLKVVVNGHGTSFLYNLHFSNRSSLPFKHIRDIKIYIYIYFIEFIEVRSVHKTIPVSSAQLKKTSSAHCIVHPSPKAKFLSIPISPSLITCTYPSLPSGYHHAFVSVFVLYIHVYGFVLTFHLSSGIQTALPVNKQLSVCSMCPSF